MKNVILLFLFIAGSTNLSAQSLPLQWIKTYGGVRYPMCCDGNKHDWGRDAKTTFDGNLIILGSTNSDTIDVHGNHGGEDMWVAKLNDTGAITWQKCYGGSGGETPSSIQQTRDTGYIIAGTTTSKNSGQVGFSHGSYDFWIVKTDDTGKLQWAKAYGGTGEDYGYSIAQTYDGGYIVTGISNSNDGDVSGNHGNYDAWVIRLDDTGAIIWQKCLGGSDFETNYMKIITTKDSCYLLCVNTNSNDGDVSGYHDSTDVWVVKLADTGNHVQWKRTFGGSCVDNMRDVIQNADGDYVLTGTSSRLGGDFNYLRWTVKLSGSGTIIAQAGIAGVIQQTFNKEYIYGVDYLGSIVARGSIVKADSNFAVLDSNYKLTVDEGGGFASIDWPAAVGQKSDSTYFVAGSYFLPYRNYHIFVKKYGPPAVYISYLFANQQCTGTTVNIPFTAFGQFNSGNVFTVQLSDSSGSFASPTVIGRDTTTTSGSVAWTIPASLPTGSHYYLRVVASNPQFISPAKADNIRISAVAASKPVIHANNLVCSGDTLFLGATDSMAAVSYSWIGPSGFNSSLQSPVIVPVVAGKYKVRALLFGCPSFWDSTTIGIIPLPYKPQLTTNKPVCSGDTLFLSATDSSVAVNYSWTGPASFSSHSKDTIIYPAVAGKFYSRVIDTNGCKSAIDSISVVVHKKPATPLALSNTPVCSSDTLLLKSTDSTTMVKFHWSGPGSFLSPSKDTLVYPPVAGNYQVWVTDTIGCNSSKGTITAVVHLIPVSPTLSSNSPLCEDDTVHLISSSTSPAINYHWSGPSFAASSGHAIVYPAVAGKYFSWVTDTNNCNSARDSIVVSLKLKPSKPITVKPPPLCSLDSTFLAATDTTAGVNYYWQDPANSIFSTNPLLVYNASSGFYKVWVQLNGCSSFKDSIYLSVIPYKVPGVEIISKTANAVFPITVDTFIANVTNGGTNPSFQWYKNGSKIAGANLAQLILWQVEPDDVISVQVHSNEDCIYPDTAFAFTKTLNIRKSGNDIVLYPTPNNGTFFIRGKISSPTSMNGRISIVDAVGRLVYRDAIEIDRGMLYKQIKVNELPSALYLLELEADQIYTFPVTIVH